ncbi:MAG TPA: CDP-diacylglycerol--glycerol-3-phosphate 3-phosphatidyltransferase [Bacillota bacterium]|nr:CDP-diacylglycerol--glycerol-3-phosphate 3-phosphatidyltransferase [Bacillota bacterium]
MTIANWITTSRMILAPVCVGILFWDIPGRDLLAAVIFIIAGITDGLDGYAARIMKETSSFGKSFDPFADKFLIILTLVVLANLNRVSWIAVWIIISREILITVLRHFAGKKGFSVSASPWGKLKTFSQIVAVSFIMLEKIWSIPFSQWLLWISVVLTVISGLDYLWRWKGAFGNSENLDSKVQSP